MGNPGFSNFQQRVPNLHHEWQSGIENGGGGPCKIRTYDLRIKSTSHSGFDGFQGQEFAQILLGSSCCASETEPTPNPVSMAAGSSLWNANGIIELRAVRTDLDPNDATDCDAHRGCSAMLAKGAVRGVSRGPAVAPLFTQGTRAGQQEGSVTARRNCPAGDHSVRLVRRPESTSALPGGGWRPRSGVLTAIEDSALHVIVNMIREFDWSDARDK